MRNLLAVLLIAGLVAPAMGAQVFFNATADGSFNTYRSGNAEGYTNAGIQGMPRLSKSNQHMGWLSFMGAAATDGSGSLASYVAAHPGTTATMYVRTSAAMPGKLALISIRSGNQGGLVEDQGTGGSYAMTAPAPGYTGASELQAFRGCSTAPLAAFPAFGDGIYTLEDPNNTLGVQGQAWISPSTRAANAGKTPFQVGANQPIRYDQGIWGGWNSGGTQTPNGKYRGYFPDSATAGRNYWALEDLLGLYNQRGAGDATTVTAAGQIVNGGAATPQWVDSSVAAASDPKTNTAGTWLAIPIDAAFLADMASNPENKGLVFTSEFAGGVADWSNTAFYTKDQSGGAYVAYLAIPEPATMILLALGGLVALRRRSA